jgi:hypothetical protein
LQASKGHQSNQNDSLFIVNSQLCRNALIQDVLELSWFLCLAKEWEEQITWVLSHNNFQRNHAEALHVAFLS